MVFDGKSERKRQIEEIRAENEKLSKMFESGQALDMGNFQENPEDTWETLKEKVENVETAKEAEQLLGQIRSLRVAQQERLASLEQLLTLRKSQNSFQGHSQKNEPPGINDVVKSFRNMRRKYGSSLKTDGVFNPLGTVIESVSQLSMITAYLTLILFRDSGYSHCSANTIRFWGNGCCK